MRKEKGDYMAPHVELLENNEWKIVPDTQHKTRDHSAAFDKATEALRLAGEGKVVMEIADEDGGLCQTFQSMIAGQPDPHPKG